MNSIESLLELSLKRKPKRLTIWRNEELSLTLLADWPPNYIRDGVKQWLEEQNVINANDILDGACEPLARYLSYQMKMEVEHDEFNSISKSSNTLKSKLELLDPRESAEFNAAFNLYSSLAICYYLQIY